MVKINKNQKNIQDVLNDCLEGILIRNETDVSCLSRYPDYSKELKPLVETIKAAHTASNISPNPSFRAQARYEFHRVLNENSTKPAVPIFSWRWRWATVIASLGVFLITASGGVVAASANSMPGQPLYQLKRNIENVQLTMSPSKTTEARFYAVLADRRVGEIVYAAQSGDVQLTQKLTEEFASSLRMVSAVMGTSNTLAYGGDATKSGALSTYEGITEQSPLSTDTTASDSNPSGIAELPPRDTVPQAAPAMTPILTIPQATITLSGIDDPVLLKLLQQYSAKNLAELMATLDEVSPSVKDALLTAIETAAEGYSQILGE